MEHRRRRWLPVAASAALAFLLGASDALAHCDTLDGPVVSDARAALVSGDVEPVLKWVRPEAEDEIREAFRLSRAVRPLGPQAQALADRLFFETVVRIHRQVEGAPFTGLKPAGLPPDPAVAAADQALAAGSADDLVKLVASQVEAGLRSRFDRAASARKRATESVERGRDYVAAYVEFVHYAERLHLDATTAGASHSSHEDPSGGAHRH
jgi:hypothetical protein